MIMLLLLVSLLLLGCLLASREMFDDGRYRPILHRPRLPRFNVPPSQRELDEMVELVVRIGETARRITDLRRSPELRSSHGHKLCSSLRSLIDHENRYIQKMPTMTLKQYNSALRKAAQRLGTTVEPMQHMIFEAMSLC